MTQRSGEMYVLDRQTGSKSDFGKLAVDTTATGGLLGLAFHPDFVKNRRYFAYCSMTYRSVELVELQADSSLLKDNGGAPKVLFQSFEQSTKSHMGSSIQFGLDGKLFLAFGDDGNQGKNARSLNSIQGKILRIDINGADAGKPYLIPEDNPYAHATDPNINRAIWAIGFRNPWKLSVDPVTGELWTGMVGGWYQDYASIVKKNDDMGWPILEGTTCFNGNPDPFNSDPPLATCDRGRFKLPTIPFPHPNLPGVGTCLIGGVVYRGNPQSSLYGTYFFGDMGTGQLFAATQNSGVLEELKDCGTFPIAYSHFTADHDGKIFTSNYSDGNIWMLEHPEMIKAPPAPLHVRTPGGERFKMGASQSSGAASLYRIDGTLKPGGFPASGIFLRRAGHRADRLLK